MSYCRLSSDDYRCDLYIYQSHRGFETHVAGRRHVLKEPLPERIDLPKGFTDEQFDKWCERYRTVGDMVDAADLVDIDLPHAGESFLDATPGECADRAEHLRSLGYHVPQDAIDALRTEETQ